MLYVPFKMVTYATFGLLRVKRGQSRSDTVTKIDLTAGTCILNEEKLTT